MAIADRMMRAARGNADLFEEVEHDPAATAEALTVVALVAVAGGIGAAITQLAHGHPLQAVMGVGLGVISGLIGWAIFSGVTYFIGTRLFNAEATWEEVLRTLGYAYAPMVVSIVSFVPVLGGLIVLVAAIWTLYLGFIAIRAALDVSSGQTVATILLSIIPAGLISAIVQIPLLAARL